MSVSGIAVYVAFSKLMGGVLESDGDKGGRCWRCYTRGFSLTCTLLLALKRR